MPILGRPVRGLSRRREPRTGTHRGRRPPVPFSPGMAVALAGHMRLPCRYLISHLVVLLLWLAQSPSATAWSLALAGRIERVAAAGDRVAAVRGETAILLREDGTPLGRVEDIESPPSHRKTRISARDEEDVLDFLGIDESEQDSAWVEDQLDDESTLSERRTMRGGHSGRALPHAGLAPTVAAAGQDIWVATGRGLWRLPSEGDLVHVVGRDSSGALLAAGFDHQVLLASGNQVWLVSESDGTRRVLATVASVQHVALSFSGRRMAWASRRQVMWSGGIDERPSQALPLPEPVADLKFCGETLLLLSRGGLAVLSPEGVPERRSVQVAARHLACSADGVGPWLASGPDLLVSYDEGRTWSSLPIPRGVRALDAAVGSRCLWLATDKGLYCSSPDEPVAGELASDGETRSAPRPVGPREASWWATWLPRLTVRAGAAFAAGRREYQTVALASFPLDAPRTRAVLVADNDEAPSPPAPRPADLSIPADAEADCLHVARAKAVALALVEPERGRSYVDRARHAAWLPEIRLRVDRRLGRSESLDQPSTSTAITSPLGVDTVDDVRYEARVTWDLARLIFSSDELAAQAQTIHMAEIRRDIEVTLSRLYFERRRLGLERLPPSSGERTQALRRELRLREIESELDALSGGAFSQCTAGRASAQGGP